MLAHFQFSFNAVAPMLVLILVGCTIRRCGIFSESFFPDINRFIFKFFLPVMLYNGIYNIESLPSVNWPAVAVCVAGIFLMFCVGYLAQRFLIPDPRQKGVIWQCMFRSNFALIGLPLAQSLGGDEALAFGAVISAFVQLSFNSLAVIALTSASSNEREQRLKKIAGQMIRNPMIIASLLGLATLGLRMVIPQGSDGQLVFSIRQDLPFLYTAIGNAAKVASPLAMVSLGAQFSLPRERAAARPMAVGVIGRIVVAPILGLCLACLVTKTGLVRFGASEYPAVIALFGTPVGVSSAVLVQSAGGDVKLANQLVVFTSILSMLTLVVLIGVVKGMGLL